MTPYRCAADVLADRIRWATVVLSHLVQRGRSEGWVEGAPLTMDLADVDAVDAAITERVAISEPELETCAMQWLSTRLSLSRAQEAALWLLCCIELSPAVARLA